MPFTLCSFITKPFPTCGWSGSESEIVLFPPFRVELKIHTMLLDVVEEGHVVFEELVSSLLKLVEGDGE